MEKTKKPNIFKFLITFLFTAAIIAGIVYVNIKGDLKKPYITFACVGVSFLMSMLFIARSNKKVYLTLALAVTVAAHYFWFFDPLGGKDYTLIGVSLFLASQFFYMLYSLTLTRAIFLKIVDIALRVALTLLIVFVLINFVKLSTVQIIGLVYIANAAVTLLSIIIHIKTEWLTLIGFLLLFASGVFTVFLMDTTGALHLTSAFLEFLLKNYTYLIMDTYLAGLLIISLSSVWAKRKTLIK